VHRRRVAEPTVAIPLRPAFTAGATLSRGISALLQRPLTYLGFTLAQAVPVPLSLGLLFAVIGANGWQRVSATGSYPGWFWPLYIAACFACLLPYGAALHTAAEQLAGRTVSFGDALIVGARRFLPLTGVFLLFALGVMGGMMALFVPAIIVGIIYIVAMPIAVQERRGVRGALHEAARLSKGHRVALFVIGVGYVAITIAGYLGALLTVAVTSVLFGVVGLHGDTAGTIVISVVLGIVGAALVALFSVLLAATYVGLRDEKQGGSAEQLASVFT
jgi:hypothetical protein